MPPLSPKGARRLPPYNLPQTAYQDAWYKLEYNQDNFQAALFCFPRPMQTAQSPHATCQSSFAALTSRVQASQAVSLNQPIIHQHTP